MKHQAMRHMDNWRFSPPSFSAPYWSGQLHAPAVLPPGKQPNISIANNGQSEKGPVWILWRKKLVPARKRVTILPFVVHPVT